MQSRSLRQVLQRSFVVQVQTFVFQPITYHYTFRLVSDDRDPGTVVSSSWEVDILKEADHVSATHRFKLYEPQDTPNRAVIVCEELPGIPLRAHLCIPAMRSARDPGVWILEGTYKDMRALLSMNRPEEGFGVTTMVLCNKIRMQLGNEMVLQCFAPEVLGGWLISTSNVPDHVAAPSQPDHSRQEKRLDQLEALL